MVPGDNWRVEWVTRDQGFCFATVSTTAPAGTTCVAGTASAAAGADISAQTVTIAGLAGDDVCGFVRGDATYVLVAAGMDSVMAVAQPIGSGLTGYCAPMPDSWASPEPYTVSAYDQGMEVGSASSH
jgi:hypothetical protein